MRRSHRSSELKRQQAAQKANSDSRFAELTRSPRSALLFQAWALGKLSDDQIMALATVANHPTYPFVIDRQALERVLAAFAGRLDSDTLDDNESRLFMALFAEYMSKPNPESTTFAAMTRSEGGYVGDDEQGHLVRTLPSGGVEVIDDPSNGSS